MISENEKIANRIKDFRKRHNLSQGELAEELGISRQSVIALEQGKSMPSLPLVISICEFFHSPFEEIFAIQREIEEEIQRVEDSFKHDIINILPAQPHIEDSTGEKETIMSNEMEPWRPFREAVSLRDAMDRLFEDSFITPKGLAIMPKIDIKDQKDKILVKAELPGMTEDQIDIEISDGVMTISGEKKEDAAFATGEAGAPASAESGMRGKEDGEYYYHKESHTGSFSRSFQLPADVKEDKAEAEMKNGILTVALPKVEPKKATKVKIAPKKK